MICSSFCCCWSCKKCWYHLLLALVMAIIMMMKNHVVDDVAYSYSFRASQFTLFVLFILSQLLLFSKSFFFCFFLFLQLYRMTFAVTIFIRPTVVERLGLLLLLILFTLHTYQTITSKCLVPLLYPCLTLSLTLSACLTLSLALQRFSYKYTRRLNRYFVGLFFFGFWFVCSAITKIPIRVRVCRWKCVCLNFIGSFNH